jgi:hypothetical protein
VQIPRADVEIVTNKLTLIFLFFINMLLLYFNVQYTKQESVNKSFVRVRLYYLYLSMDVCTIFFTHF